MTDKISVIMPVYNVASYIKKSLDSVLNQTYGNLEILCIDDGSIDGSGEICDQYAEKDKRIRVFHKSNGGLSSALNVGLTHFTGAYLGVVDSDDWIEPDMYAVLYENLTEAHANLSAVNFFRDTEQASVIEVGRESIPERLLIQKEMLLYVFRPRQYAGFYVSVCNKLFSAELIRASGLCFDESLRISMDHRFITELILSGNPVGIYTDRAFYHYYQRGDSLIRTPSVLSRLDRLRCLKENARSADRKGYPDIAVWEKREHCYSASLIAEDARRMEDHSLWEQMCREMHIYLKEYKETNRGYPERLERMECLLSW